MKLPLIAWLLAGVFAWATACSSAAMQPTGELRINFADATSTTSAGWFLDVSIDGGAPRRVQVDTGSVGLVIGAAAIPLSAKKVSDGSITFSSSGKTLSGSVYLVTIGYPALTGVTTVQMPVLGVKTVTCNLALHPDCVVAPGEANQVGILGVGFGRHGSGADLADVVHEPEASVNPFLQLGGMANKTLLPAYTIAPDHISFGIAPGQSPRWQSFALTPAGGGDWNPLPGCVRAGSYAPRCAGGTMLVDTGVGTAILSVPGQSTGAVPAGTPVTLTIGAEAPATFLFTSTGATCSGSDLSCVRWSHRAALPIFVNTSRRLIARAAYRFDNASGTVSFLIPQSTRAR